MFLFQAEIMMTDFHLQRINVCYQDLVNKMVVDRVMLCLVSADIINIHEYEDIFQLGGMAKKAGALLDILARRSDQAFDTLVNALQSTDQSHLADMLLRERES